MARMILLYLFAAALIAWGIVRDWSRRETWLIGFGTVTRRDKPGIYWLALLLRGFILLVVIVAAWLRSQY